MERDLGRLKCSEMTSDKLVAFARSLSVKPQTRANYFSHLSPDLRDRNVCLENIPFQE